MSHGHFEPRCRSQGPLLFDLLHRGTAAYEPTVQLHSAETANCEYENMHVLQSKVEEEGKRTQHSSHMKLQMISHVSTLPAKDGYHYLNS